MSKPAKNKPVPALKAQKIDLKQSYPCPCCHYKGKLQPIALTDALGCDRCHLIFVVESDGQSLMPLNGIDPYRRTWYWVGDKWQLQHGFSPKYPINLLRTGFILIFSLFIVFLLQFVATQNPGLPFIFMMVILLLLISWVFFMSHWRDF